MHKKFKNFFENERKIERRSFVTERERRSKFPHERWARAQAIFFERTKALGVGRMEIQTVYASSAKM